MDYNYSRLMGKIKEVYGRREPFASALGMGAATLSLKLNNKAEWSQDEMVNALELLGEPINEIESYFFTHQI